MNREEAEKLAQKLIDKMFPEETLERTPAKQSLERHKEKHGRYGCEPADGMYGWERDYMDGFREGIEWLYQEIINWPSYSWSLTAMDFFKEYKEKGTK